MSRLLLLAIASAITVAGLRSVPLVAQSASELSVTPLVAEVAAEPVGQRVNALAPMFISPNPSGLLARRVPDSSWSGQDTTRRRAVTYSEWYSRRLRAHRYGSYAMLPLFVTQFVLGNQLLKQKDAQYAGTRTTPIDDNLRKTHVVVAGTVGVLFVVNTTTGLWNLFESRHTLQGRKLRTIHALTMLAADAGFAYTGYVGSDAVNHGPSQARRHRNAGLVSFGIATTGASLMWFRRD